MVKARQLWRGLYDHGGAWTGAATRVLEGVAVAVRTGGLWRCWDNPATQVKAWQLRKVGRGDACIGTARTSEAAGARTGEASSGGASSGGAWTATDSKAVTVRRRADLMVTRAVGGNAVKEGPATGAWYPLARMVMEWQLRQGRASSGVCWKRPGGEAVMAGSGTGHPETYGRNGSQGQVVVARQRREGQREAVGVTLVMDGPDTPGLDRRGSRGTDERVWAARVVARTGKVRKEL